MAVATPVLERKLNTEDESDYKRENYKSAVMSEDEKHNSQISSNYAKLINPEYTLKDIIVKEAEVQPKAEIPVHELYAQKPYRVENARADADIFRADSEVNKRLQAEVLASSASAEEEENEDLRPTPTTIQYKTAGVKKVVEEGKIENTSAKRRLSKREKITIAAIVSVVVALFVLIIINSAIISSVSSDISALNTSLESVSARYADVSGELNAYRSNLTQIVSEFAQSNGMVLK